MICFPQIPQIKYTQIPQMINVLICAISEKISEICGKRILYKMNPALDNRDGILFIRKGVDQNFKGCRITFLLRSDDC